MATPVLDVSLLQYFTPIIIFLLVWVIVYAILASTKTLGDNKLLHAIIGVLIALIVLFSKSATGLITIMAPWFTVFFIFCIFVILLYKIFGATDANIKSVLQHYSALHWTIAIICIVVALGALANVFGQSALVTTQGNVSAAEIGGALAEGSTGTTDYSQNLWATLFHPKIVGTVFLLIIATFAIALLAGKVRPSWPPDSFFK